MSEPTINHELLRKLSRKALLHESLADFRSRSDASRSRADKALFELCRVGTPGYDPTHQSDGYYFDADAARNSIRFFAEQLRHAKGSLFGKPFVLEPWQQCVQGNIFGWKSKATGLRRYREVLIYVAKKNGKSAWVAGMVLYVMVADGEKGAELYSAASNREQAALIFQHADGMVRHSRVLKSILKVYGTNATNSVRSIVYPDAMSSYKCLAADANSADGVNPHFVAADEIHRHKKPDLVNVLQKSAIAREQPLVVYTTTADYNRPSVCNTKLKYAKRVRSNEGREDQPGYDPAFYPVVFEAGAEADHRDPKVWRRANPNIGVTITEEKLARECRKADEEPSELNDFLRLHLNIVTDADQAWLPMDDWDRGAGDLEYPEYVESLRGDEPYGGLDLSLTRDPSSFSLYFPGQKALAVWNWMPREVARMLEQRSGVPYSQWARDGFLELIDGPVVDHDFVEARVRQICQEFGCRMIAFDPYMAAQMAQHLEGDGIEMVKHQQGFKSMAEPTALFERMVIAGELRHGGHPMLRWNASNVVVELDAHTNKKPSKKKSTESIDGVVASIMAIGLASLAPAPKDSIYNTREPLIA